MKELSEPPRKLLPFCLHFTKGAWPYIILASLLMAGIAIAEVWLFGFWAALSTGCRTRTAKPSCRQKHGSWPAWHLCVLVSLPSLILSIA
ncbi:hypothetical protein ULF88_18640 [Halopseudomonas pachastrellae]|nr:hypothetical protein [Halopseudomonas pachastrellae]